MELSHVSNSASGTITAESPNRFQLLIGAGAVSRAAEFISKILCYWRNQLNGGMAHSGLRGFLRGQGSEPVDQDADGEADHHDDEIERRQTHQKRRKAEADVARGKAARRKTGNGHDHPDS